MEKAKIKKYVTENLDQIPDNLLAEIAQLIYNYYLDQASQSIEALDLTEFTHEQLAQLAGVPISLIEEKSKPIEKYTSKINKISRSKRPREILGSLQVTAIYTGKIENRGLPRCWFDESKQRWIKGASFLLAEKPDNSNE